MNRASRACFGRCLALLVIFGSSLLALGAGEVSEWFSIPIEVGGLPATARSVPISVALDLTSALEALGVTGVVDGQSFRLYRLDDRGEPQEERYQFTATPQPRLEGHRMLAGTVPGVSYIGEVSAGQESGRIRVAGQLAWIVSGAAEGASHRYRLDFAVPGAGRAIQVPYAPQDLRVFDEQNRATAVRWFPQMQIRPQWPHEGVLHLFEANRPITSYHLGARLTDGNATPTAAFRRPFFYPVNGPDGVPLTELGKPHDPTGSHAHHYSFWIGHADVNGNDFWSERGGVIAHEELQALEDGPVFCRIRQKTRWLAGGAAVLSDVREFTVYEAGPDFRLIDVDLRLAPVGEAVTFGKTTFGFLAIRVAQSMSVFDGGGEILNSHGDRNEQRAHLQRADWIDQAGPVLPDRWNGIGILDHPENPNHPTGWHCRNDGWAGAAFNQFGPSRLGSGESLRLRYRVVLHRGNAAAAQIDDRYRDYSAKPVVKLGAPARRAAVP